MNLSLVLLFSSSSEQTVVHSRTCQTTGLTLSDDRNSALHSIQSDLFILYKVIFLLLHQTQSVKKLMFSSLTELFLRLRWPWST